MSQVRLQALTCTSKSAGLLSFGWQSQGTGLLWRGRLWLWRWFAFNVPTEAQEQVKLISKFKSWTKHLKNLKICTLTHLWCITTCKYEYGVLSCTHRGEEGKGGGVGCVPWWDLCSSFSGPSPPAYWDVLRHLLGPQLEISSNQRCNNTHVCRHVFNTR